MNRISDFTKRHHAKKLEDWTTQAIWVEIFFIAIFPPLATAAIAIGLILWILRLKDDDQFNLRSLPLDLPLMLFVFLSAASVFFSPVRSVDLFTNFLSLMSVYVLGYILIGQNIRTPEQIQSVTKALGVAAIVVVFGGYFQYIFGVDVADMKWIDGEAFPELRKRVFSTLENPNVLAGYLDVMICIALGLLAKFGDRKEKIFLLVAIVLMVACLAMTYSRGAFLTLVVVLVIYGVVQDWRALIFFSVLFAIIFFGNSTFSERIVSIFTETLDSSEGLRIGIWVSTIPMIADHPFTGVGWGAFKLIYPQYNYYLADPSITIYHAHNIYLNTAAEVGIAGALAYFWFIFGTMLMALDLSSNRRYQTVSLSFKLISLSFLQKFFKDVKISKRLNYERKLLKHQISQLFKKKSEKKNDVPPEDDSKKRGKKQDKKSADVVHHEELKWHGKKKSDDKDDDKFDLQKFAEPSKKELKEIRNKNFVEGVRFGIGLAFLSMAVNGFADNLLFNLQSSMLMWQLGALAAACQMFLVKLNQQD